ncbi:MAG: MOSC domain-containing protein [bacterium]|nr:MOSC domain-containing protein [bacterium]MCP5068049.1 MOSC domain-containing protein [bacterium]
MADAHIESLNLGGVESVRFADGGEIQSAIRKRPQTGVVNLTMAGLPGDEVNHHAHGGPNRALHVYPIEHYATFEEAAGHPFPVPCFGENFTLRGLTEAHVRVGDIWQVGTARLQVTMPTERCAHPGRLAGEPRIMKRIVRDALCGWYLRVLEPGELQAGDEVTRVDVGPGEVTLVDLHVWMRDQAEDPTTMQRVLAMDALAPEWKERMSVLHERRRRT